MVRKVATIVLVCLCLSMLGLYMIDVDFVSKKLEAQRLIAYVSSRAVDQSVQGWATVSNVSGANVDSSMPEVANDSTAIGTAGGKMPILAEAIVPDDVLFAAVMIVGHARTLVWDIVCENIKTRLLDGLAAPPRENSSQRWQVDLFLFLSLDDADSRKGRLKQSHDERMLQKCIQKLNPVYVEFMPATYTPPKEHGCSKGNEPNYLRIKGKPGETGWPERIFSQCKRVDIAQDYILKTFEPSKNRRYSAILKTRPDAVYLKKVPPLWETGGISTVTHSAAAYGDAYTFVPRGCRIAGTKCIGCADTAVRRCTNESMIQGHFDPKVHPVLARANTREFFDQHHIKLPKEQRSRKDRFGWLNLECDRWKRVMLARTPELWTGDKLCKAEAKIFLRAHPPADPDSVHL